MNFKELVIGLSVLALLTAPSYAAGQRIGQPAPSASQARLGELPASELIGKRIIDARGEDLGEIKDFLVDLRSAKAHTAVLDFGGALGLGEKQHVFPVTELQRGSVEGKLLLNVNRSELASAGSSREEGAAPDLKRASTVIGMAVEDAEYRQVGNIRDFIVSLDSGLIRSFVIDIENDRAEPVVAPSSLSAGRGDKLLVNMSRDELIRNAKAARRSSGSGSSGSSLR